MPVQGKEHWSGRRATRPLHVATHLAPRCGACARAGPTTLLPPLKSERPPVRSHPRRIPIPNSSTEHRTRRASRAKPEAGGTGEASKPRAIRTKRPASPSSSFPSSPPLAEALYIPAPRVDGLPPCAEAAAAEEEVGCEAVAWEGGRKRPRGDGVARRVREAGDPDEHAAGGHRQCGLPHGHARAGELAAARFRLCPPPPVLSPLARGGGG